jgi:hypothetical protein
MEQLLLIARKLSVYRFLLRLGHLSSLGNLCCEAWLLQLGGRLR